MKKLLLIALVAISTSLFAQTPEGINYQAVARDGSDALIVNQSVKVRAGIYSGATASVKEYEETHVVTTNAYGHFNLIIGQGAATAGTFGTIDWGNNRHHLKIEMDPAGGNSYVNLGTTELQSVPYALNAKSVDNLPTINFNDLADVSVAGATNGQSLTFDGINWIATTATGGSTYSAGIGLNLTGTTFSADNTSALWNANQLNGNPIGSSTPANGQVLSWNGSNWLPTTPSSYSAGTGLSITGNTIAASNTSALWNANQLQGNAVSTTNPTSGQVLSWNGTNWLPTTPATAPTYSAGTGVSISGNTIAANNSTALWNSNQLQGNAVSTTSPTNGQVLSWTGSNWAPSTVGSGGTFSAGSGINISGTTISSTNTTAIWNASQLQGTAMATTTPSNGQVLTFNGTQWAPSTISTGANYTAGTGLTLTGNAFSANTSTALWNANQLQGTAVSTTTPSNGQVLSYNGTQWVPSTPSGGGTTYTAGTGLTLSGTVFSANATAALWNANQLQGRSVANTTPNSGEVLKWNGANWAPAVDNNSISPWSLNGTTAFRTDRVGIGVNAQNNLARFHVRDSVNTNSVTFMSDHRLIAATNTTSVNAALRGALEGRGGAINIGVVGRADGTVSTTGSSMGFEGTSEATGQNNYGARLRAEIGATTRSYGVYATSKGDGTFNMGGLFIADNGSATTNYGIYAWADSATNNNAGYFDGDIDYTGTLTGPSDAKLKSGVEDYKNALQSIANLRVTTYKFRRDGDAQYMNLPTTKQYGFIAQELEQEFPELIKNNIKPINPGSEGTDETIEYKSVNYIGLIPVLTKSIQEQQELIQNLQDQVKALQTEIEKLK